MDSLKKIYYIKPEEHKKTYEQRYAAPFTKHIPIQIREFNHDKQYPAFYYYPEELVLQLEMTEKHYLEFLHVLAIVPPLVQHQFSLSCIVDEVGSTSAIEGIHSSKEELKALLDGESSEGQFASIIKKYHN